MTSVVGIALQAQSRDDRPREGGFPCAGQPAELDHVTVPHVAQSRDQMDRRIAVSTLSGGWVPSMSTAPNSEPSKSKARTRSMRCAR